jgi:hypothetical protein
MWRIEAARNGRPALVRPDGVWAESRFAPDVDAARRVLDAGVSPDESVLLIGCGGGELPRALLDGIGAQGRLFIADPCAAAVAALLRSGRAQELFADPRVTFLLYAPDNLQDWAREPRVRAASTASAFYALLSEAHDYDRFLVHPGLCVPEELAAFRERMDDLEIRRRSSARFRGDVERNLALNREADHRSKRSRGGSDRMRTGSRSGAP